MLNTYLPLLITLILMCVVVLFGRFAFSFEASRFGGYSFKTESVEHDNPAVNIRLIGMVVGLIVAVFGAYTPTTDNLANLTEVAHLFVYALVALMISRHINNRFILSMMDTREKVVKEKNVSVAIVEAATYVATGAVFAGGMADASHGVVYTIVWFLIGQCVLIGLAKTYGRILPSMFEQVVTDNRACALSLSGLLLAAGIVIGALIRGPFEGWTHDLTKVGFGFLIWLCVAITAKALLNFGLIPGNRAIKEMVEDRSWTVGLADAAIVLAFTAMFIIMFAA